MSAEPSNNILFHIKKPALDKREADNIDLEILMSSLLYPNAFI
jgi:hypothetical protein